MRSIILYLLEFIVSFFLIFLYYRIFIVKKDEKVIKKKLPPELSLFIKLNKIDIKKISYKSILKKLSIVNGLVIAFTLLIVEITDKLMLKLLLAIPVCTVLMYVFYKLLGLYYKKKGMIRNV